MDVNAGAYLDGMPMDELGAQTLDLAVAVASGQPCAGEKAGHAQVQIWRDWRQTDPSHLAELLNQPLPDGASLPVLAPSDPTPEIHFTARRVNGTQSLDKVALVLPTSLCAGQVARLAANRLNRQGVGREQGISRFVSLVHTEGCGVSGGTSEDLYIRTMLGYMTHPLVGPCLLLEHGCEKTHNDYMRNQLRAEGIDPSRLGWASVQLDGGIENVLGKIETWFSQAIAQAPSTIEERAGLEALRIGLASAGPVSAEVAAALSELTRQIVAAGGSVVLPQNSGLLSSPIYLENTLGSQPAMPTLAYGAPMPSTGFHIMETPTAHWVETLTGLGATGVDVIVASIGEHPLQTHPMIPLLQITDQAAVHNAFGPDLDLWLEGAHAQWPAQILTRIAAIADHDYSPQLYQLGNIDFQMTRGLLGVSM
jgi:altronate dehydratase